MVERAWEQGRNGLQFRLDDKIEKTLGEQFPAYYTALRRKRAQLAAAHAIDTCVAVIDGHQKLTRPCCAVKRSCTLPCERLGQMAVVTCPESPAGRKGILCAKHVALAARNPQEFGANAGLLKKPQTAG